MLTEDHLRAIMPALPAVRRGQLLPVLQAAATEFAITTPARLAAFLAQLAHESGQFRFMEELWGPTEAQRRYEPASTLAARLGNIDTGDGRRFKGRGPIQITGRANYRRYGELLGIDLLADPARAASPDPAFRIAALFWAKNGLNELADQATAAAFQQITRRINGGLNGLEDRQAFYAVARTVLGVVETSLPRGVERAPTPAPPDTAAPFGRGHEVIRELAKRRPRKPASARRARSGSKRVTAKAKTAAPKARRARTGSTRSAAAAPRGPRSSTSATRQRASAKRSRGNR